jgi:hypothetical protein
MSNHSASVQTVVGSIPNKTGVESSRVSLPKFTAVHDGLILPSDAHGIFGCPRAEREQSMTHLQLLHLHRNHRHMSPRQFQQLNYIRPGPGGRSSRGMPAHRSLQTRNPQENAKKHWVTKNQFRPGSARGHLVFRDPHLGLGKVPESSAFCEPMCIKINKANPI